MLPCPPTFARFVICRNIDQTGVRTAADTAADVCCESHTVRAGRARRARPLILSVDRPWTAG
ncbi:MAG: hypothetical protein DMF84_08615 [Acidobacteria bacterium]|nr:MAG: hypothetical protein DMF84_08615 [Acidobacteriota bacterium]